MSEIPVHFRPRKLTDWINPTDAKKVHSLIDKVYKRKNLEMAWETRLRHDAWAAALIALVGSPIRQLPGEQGRCPLLLRARYTRLPTVAAKRIVKFT